VFEFANAMGGLSEGKDVKFPAKAVEWARRYTPGTSIWWARQALSAQVFDRLQELADPAAYQKRRRRVRSQERKRGNSYYWEPGERLPHRFPEYGG